MAQPKLLLVYNAEPGIVNMLIDAVHKQLSPSTYPCSLCALTYGAVSMKSAWKAYLDTLPHAKQFYHGSEFARAWPDAPKAELPAIFFQQGENAPQVAIAADALNRMASLEELCRALDAVRARADAPMPPP